MQSGHPVGTGGPGQYVVAWGSQSALLAANLEADRRQPDAHLMTRLFYTSLPMRVVVIIPAAGLGTRMAAQSGTRPGQATKQFAEIAGKPILLHTLEKFAQVPEVTDIYIAVRDNEMDRIR